MSERSRYPQATPRHRRIAREVTWVATGQVLAALGSLIGLRLMTHFLGRHEFGVLALSLTVPTLLANVVFAGPGQAVMRFCVAADERGERAQLLRAAWRSLAARTGIVAVTAVVAGGAAWALGYGHLWPFGLAAAAHAVITALSTIFDGVQNALRQRGAVAWHAVLGQWSRFALAIGLFALFGRTGLVALWGYTLAAAAVLISQGLVYSRDGGFGVVRGARAGDSVWLKRINDYSLPFAAFGIVAWTQTAAERWALEAFTNTAAVGEFAALSQLGLSVMALMGNIVTQLGLPVIYQRAGEGDDRTRMKAARSLNGRLVLLTLGATAAMSLVAALFHREIFALVVDSEFRRVSPLLPILILGGGLTAAGQVAMGFVLAGTSSRPLIVPKTLAALVGAGGAVFGAWFAGVQGVVWATAAASLVYLILMAIVVLRGDRLAQQAGG